MKTQTKPANIKKPHPDEDFVFRRFIEQSKNNDWDPEEEIDKDWGRIILATKKWEDAGIQLRRIKPYAVDTKEVEEKAEKLQEKLQRHLVEIFPYKIHWDKNKNKKITIFPALINLYSEL